MNERLEADVKTGRSDANVEAKNDDADADDDDAINGNARDENAKSLQLDVSNLKSNLTNVTEERDLLFAEVQTLRNSIALHTKQL